jgi:hypothetical protein
MEDAQQMEEGERTALASVLKNRANRVDGNTVSRVTPIAPNFSAIVRASFIRARSAAWNTKRRFFSMAPGPFAHAPDAFDRGGVDQPHHRTRVAA